MTDALNGRPNMNFWIVGGAALVWNLIGLIIYVGQVTMSPDALAKMTEAHQDFFTSTPMWATAAFANALNAGVLGSLFQLLRKSWAVPMFTISLLAVIVQDADAFIMRGALDVLGVNAIIIPSMVFIIALALLAYSRATQQRGWLT